MSDDPHPSKVTKHFDICKLILKTLLLTATTAAFAQEQKVPPVYSDVCQDKLTLTIGAQNISALTLQKEKTVFYNDLRPNVTACAHNAHGDYAQLKAMEVLILQDKDFTPITSRFMLELGKLTAGGGTIVFKAGREKTEGEALFDHAFEYYADARDAYQLANSAERIVFGYQKNHRFFELGIIGKNGDGFYVIPNPQNSDFWLRTGLTLLQKTGTAHYEKDNQQYLIETEEADDSDFVANASNNYDFDEGRGNLGVRAWHDLQKGWQLIAESVIDQNRDVYVRSGAAKSGVQFSIEYGSPKNQPDFVHLTVASNLSHSRTFGHPK